MRESKGFTSQQWRQLPAHCRAEPGGATRRPGCVPKRGQARGDTWRVGVKTQLSHSGSPPGSRQKRLWKCGLYPTDRGLQGQHRGWRGKGHLGPAGGRGGHRGPFKGHDRPGTSGSTYLTVPCTAQASTRLSAYLKTAPPVRSKTVLASHRPSNEAVPRLRDKPIHGVETPMRPHHRPSLCLEHPRLPQSQP